MQIGSIMHFKFKGCCAQIFPCVVCYKFLHINAIRTYGLIQYYFMTISFPSWSCYALWLFIQTTYCQLMNNTLANKIMVSQKTQYTTPYHACHILRVAAVSDRFRRFFLVMHNMMKPDLGQTTFLDKTGTDALFLHNRITFRTFLVSFPKELGMIRRMGLEELLEVLLLLGPTTAQSRATRPSSLSCK